MLQSIRDRATGPTAWFIVGLITVPFALWGIDSYVSAPTNPKVAEVGKTDITRVQLQRAYDQSYQRLQELMGANFQPDMIDTAQLRRGALDTLVREALLNQHADAQGYRASDVQIMQSLRSQDTFQRDGSFSAERYKEVLSRSGYTPASYESRLRRALAVEQLQSGLISTAFVTDKDVDVALSLIKQERQISYLSLPLERYRAKAKITAAQIEARYKLDADRYRTAEKIKLNYVELNRQALPDAKAPDQEILQAIYDAEVKSRFTQPERRRARHILVRIDDDVDERSAKSKITALKERILSGETFDSVAKEASDDLGSRTQGGDLGWVGRGVMVPEFEEALYALEQGVISEPVLTSFGWHLIRADEVEAETVKAFADAEVQAELLSLYRQKEEATRFEQLAKQLDELSFDFPEDLNAVAEALGVQVQSSEWLTREGGPGIGGQSAVIQAAFSPEVLDRRENSAPIKLTADRLVVIRVADYAPAEQRPLETVADEIREALQTEYAEQQSLADAKAGLEKLNSGAGLQSVAGELGLTAKTPGWIARDEAEVDTVIVQQAFGMPRPAGEQPVFARAQTAQGQVLIALRAVRDGDATATQEEREALRRNLMAAQGQAEFSAYLKQTQDEISVDIDEEQI